MANRFALTRRDPFTELTRLLDHPHTWLDWPRYYWHGPLTEERAFFAPLEVFDRDGQTVVRLEMPGVEMGDIEISVSDDMLTIRGEKKHEKEVEEEHYHFSERSYGAFRRTLAIPKGIEAEKIEATYEGGVLEVMLPKAEEAETRRIEAKPKAKAKPKARPKTKAKK